MKQPIEDSRCQNLIVEDLPPVNEALVGGDDRGGLLVAPGQQPKEQTGFIPAHGKVAHLVDDQQLGIAKLLKLPLHPVLRPCPGQTGDQRLQAQEEHRMTRLDGFDPQGYGQVGLAHTRRPQHDNVLAAIHKAQAAELPDHL